MKSKVKKEKNLKRRTSVWLERFKHDKKATIVYFVLRLITIAAMIRSIFNQQWEAVFTCWLTLVLFLIPEFVEKNFKVELPTALEIVAFVFVFCAEILGELGCYYVKYSFWDSMLHTVSGFMFAAFGFCLVDILNRNNRFSFKLSPVFMSLVAFCFSMTTGVLWEFFEFLADSILHTDMQKDFIVQGFSSVTLDETASNIAIRLNDIKQTVILHADGSETVIMGGYLDIGIIDTMKDLFVNFVGAVIFSVIGYFYVKDEGNNKIASSFIPVVEDGPTTDPQGHAEAVSDEPSGSANSK